MKESIKLERVGYTPEGMEILGIPTPPPKAKLGFVGLIAYFITSHMIGTVIALAVASICIAIWPPLLGIVLIGAACLRDT